MTTSTFVVDDGDGAGAAIVAFWGDKLSERGATVGVTVGVGVCAAAEWVNSSSAGTITLPK
ncbi:MAG: hypothetical protein H6Q33_3599 [Deltaproteobacteria bacterium]|jgi:hypothetical protein|nr:hypothetical protein [Deltaproteobacteria bacterium]